MNYKAIIKKQSTIILIAVICLTIATIGVSYALFFHVESNTNNQVVKAGTLSVEYGSSSSAITATELIPMSDDEALSSSTMTGTIYVENKGTLPAKYEVAIGNDTESFNNRNNPSDKDKLINHDYLRVAAYLNGTMIVEPTTLSELTESLNSTDMYNLFEGSLDTTGSGNSTMTIVIKVWIQENAPEDIIGDFVYLKMDITSEVMEGNLKSTIITHASENGYLYTEDPYFNKATADGEYGLYTKADDYGLSYYFRGDVQNNYVQFGSYESNSTINGITYTETTPIYWRIVRVNGDGTIRMIYDGTEKLENGLIRNSATIGTNEFGNKGYTNNTSNTDITQIDSEIKSFIDEWYINNLEEVYGKYIADVIFCNDREVGYREYYEYNSFGYISYVDYYGSRFRRENSNPKLSCSKYEDKYTISNKKGNGYLNYPIGLITADEVYMAGGTSSNTNYYLYSGSYYWTISPDYYTPDYGGEYITAVDSSGALDYYQPNDAYHVRPVINLKADLEFVGNGTVDSPYQIKVLAE